ncbi:MAG: Bug family tripartite tricarboxylate transporter substrate binding protein [Burkholderiales bacterium]
MAICSCSALALTLFVSSVCAYAQSYPIKPIRILVPSAPGGSFDILSRGIAQPVAASLGQAMIVENRPATGGIVGVEALARAAPDGYTLLTAGNSHFVFNTFFYAKLPYDPRRDFAPISLIAKIPPALFVHESVAVKTLQELVTLARANPGKLNYGSAGVGHSTHLSMELIKQRTGADVVHVPYKGLNLGLQDLIAGRIQVMLYSPTDQVMAQVKAGKLRALALASDARLRTVPDIPTFTEAGLPLDLAIWMSMSAPVGTPRDIVARLNKEIVRAVALPELARIYDSNSLVPATSSPDQVSQMIEKEIDIWAPIIKSLGIKPE